MIINFFSGFGKGREKKANVRVKERKAETVRVFRNRKNIGPNLGFWPRWPMGVISSEVHG